MSPDQIAWARAVAEESYDGQLIRDLCDALETMRDAVLDAHREIECLDEDGEPTGFFACDNCKDLDETSGERVHETYPCFTVKEVQRALAGQQTMGAFRKSVMDALEDQDAA